jgi:tRNA threonylcarbamoyladenosine biosynthesis protein TsaE
MMELKVVKIASLSELREFAAELCKHVAGGQLWCLSGELGSGKTELIRQLVHLFNPTEKVTSPSYNLENRYPLGNLTACHWDLFRLGNLSNLPDLDEQIGDSLLLCLVEWPERYPDLEERTDVFIEIKVLPGSETREITIRIAKKA